MAFDLSAASPILKVRYLGAIRQQLATHTYLWSQIKKKITPVSGGSFQITSHTGRSTSAGVPLAEGGTIPTANQQLYDTMTVPNKYLYGTLQVSGQAIAASRDNVGAFVQALESEIDGLQKDTAQEMNRQLHGTGLGEYGYTTEADNTTPLLIDDGRGNPVCTLPQGKTLDCDILDADAGYVVLNTGALVCTKGAVGTSSVSVGFTGGTVAGTADADVLVRRSSTATVSAVYQTLFPMGIAGIIDDGDPPIPGPSAGLQGKPVASNAYWAAQVFDNSGTNRPLAFEDMQEVIDAIAINSSTTEKDIGLILMNYPLRRSYYKLCIAERRHINTMELDGGWKALDFNGMPLMVDAYCKRNRMYFINFDSLGFLQTADWDWMDKDGSYLTRVSGVDAYTATLFMYGNLCCYMRNCNGLLDDIIEE